MYISPGQPRSAPVTPDPMLRSNHLPSTEQMPMSLLFHVCKAISSDCANDKAAKRLWTDPHYFFACVYKPCLNRFNHLKCFLHATRAWTLSPLPVCSFWVASRVIAPSYRASQTWAKVVWGSFFSRCQPYELRLTGLSSEAEARTWGYHRAPLWW